MSEAKAEWSLDPAIWNDKLLDEAYNFYFGDVPVEALAVPLHVMQKWSGMGKTAEEKAAIDEECRQKFAHALESISPSNITRFLPPYESHEDDLHNHIHTIAAPFMSILDTQSDTINKQVLSLVVLLDQYPRNIYRTMETLPMVYKHYDRLVFALIHTIGKSHGLRQPYFQQNPMLYIWLLVAYVHHEQMDTVEIAWQELLSISTQLEGRGRQLEEEKQINNEAFTASQLMKGSQMMWQQHLDAMRRFDRYPRRNAALGRTSTAEEVEFLNEAPSLESHRDKVVASITGHGHNDHAST